MRDTQIQALAAHLAVDEDSIALMVTTGLAHRHFRIADSGTLARVPIQSQHSHSPRDNLAYQARCFEQVSKSRRAPKLFDQIGLSQALPFGALIVEEIEGRHARLPDDLSKIAHCLAEIHAEPAVPSPPMYWHNEPIAALKIEIKQQAAFLERAPRDHLKSELQWLETFQPHVQSEPTCLVCTDTHPGNFLIDRNGRALIVDLEKALYGSPSVDLAHVSVYTSTTWDVTSSAILSLKDLEEFYTCYLSHSQKADQIRPWLIPMRRMLILRALTWCAMWQHEHQKSASAWSKEHVPDKLTKHVAERTSHYLQPGSIEQILDETQKLQNVPALQIG